MGTAIDSHDANLLTTIDVSKRITPQYGMNGSIVPASHSCLTCLYRSARLSILFSAVRLCFGYMRRALIIASFGFGLAWAILFAQVFWTCERPGNRAWKADVIPVCPLGTATGVAQLICE
jgi:hypothetical protein